MMKDIKPTELEKEVKKGRIALWLDQKDLEWLAYSLNPETDSAWLIKFRANAALHKAGLKNT